MQLTYWDALLSSSLRNWVGTSSSGSLMFCIGHGREATFSCKDGRLVEEKGKVGFPEEVKVVQEWALCGWTRCSGHTWCLND